MSGYLNFDRTGHKEVDEILSMIERAGDGYHHTEFWDDSEDGKPSYIDRINEKILLAKNALAHDPEPIIGLADEHELLKEIRSLQSAVRELAAANAWQNFGECRAFTDTRILKPHELDVLARSVLRM